MSGGWKLKESREDENWWRFTDVAIGERFSMNGKDLRRDIVDEMKRNAQMHCRRVRQIKV